MTTIQAERCVTITKSCKFLLAIAALQIHSSRGVNIGVSRREFGIIKPTSGASQEYASLQGIEVQSVTTGEFNDCSKILKSKLKGPTLLVALTHYGDFNSWEMSQQLKYNVNRFQAVGCNIVAVGMGELPQAKEFLAALELPSAIDFYTDSEGALQAALGCSQGFAPNSVIPPWVRVYAMLTGIGSPGTIYEAVLGYTGTKEYSRGRNWVIDSLQDGSLKGRFPKVEDSAFEGPKSPKPDGLDKELNPFELATLRLQTGSNIVQNWSKLRPNKEELFTYQGGSFLFSETGEMLYGFRDPGILNYANPLDILKILETK